MKICIAGKNNIAVEILLFLLKKGIEKKDILVICNKTDEGKDTWQRSLLKQAKELNIEIKDLDDIYLIDDLLFLSLEFDRIINPSRFRSSNLFNIHFSLLPKYKGMFTSIMPILNNESKTGVSFHRIDKGIDTGAILSQLEFKIDIMDNSRDIYFKYIKYGITLVKQCLCRLLNNDFIDCQIQSTSNSTYFSKSAIDFSNIKIDLNQTAINIHNQIRAFNFREYQVPQIFDKNIISSKILKSSSNKKPGEVLFENNISFVISTIDYDIVLFKDKTEDLFSACENGCYNTVTELLQIPKIVNVQNKFGWTPLIVSIYNNQKILLSYYY